MFRKQTNEEEKNNIITPIQSIKNKSSYHKPLNNNFDYKNIDQKMNYE